MKILQIQINKNKLLIKWKMMIDHCQVHKVKEEEEFVWVKSFQRQLPKAFKLKEPYLKENNFKNQLVGLIKLKKILLVYVPHKFKIIKVKIQIINKSFKITFKIKLEIS